ncbi:MAG: hypothetical protein M3O28_14315 [Actinomycetota bacterium]|nr:hypothetical protein [Actinomycetota bacterium]
MSGGGPFDRDPSVVWIDPESHTEVPRDVALSVRIMGRRPALLAIVAAVLTVVAGLTWLALRSPASTLTLNGATISRPDATLRDAQTQFAAYVRARAGVIHGSPRCYFQRPAQQAAGGTTEVASSVLCGPVLFYDGSEIRPYLTYSSRVVVLPNGSVRLVVSGAPDDPEPAAAKGMLLVRPDMTSSPRSTAGFAVPIPPAAPANALAPVAVIHPARLPPAPRTAVIGSNTTTITLDEVGPVTDFGSGPAERSAPPGQRLIGFTVDFGSGENLAAPVAALQIGVSVDGATARRLPAVQQRSNHLQLFVIAVSTAATAVDLVLTDSGYTQRLSLLTGAPAPNNIAILRSNGAFRNASAHGDAVADVHDPGALVAHLTITLDGAGIYFFVPGTYVHPASPATALLDLDLCYHSADLADGNICHSFRPTDVTVTPTGAPAVHGRYISLNGSSQVMYEVPATMTTGTLTIAGSEAGDGFAMTIRRPVTIPFTLTLVLGVNR